MQHRSSAGSASITSSKSGGNDNSNDDQTSTSFLPKGFAPGENDIVIGRSMKYFNHSGNRALRSMVASRLEEYSEADKSEKSFIISEVMEQIKANSNTGAGFLKLDPASGLWYEVGEYLSREKVSQTFRDALGNYRSSSQCKKERRKIERAQAYAEAEQRNAKRQRLNMVAAPTTSSSFAPQMLQHKKPTGLITLHQHRAQQSQQEPVPMLSSRFMEAPTAACTTTTRAPSTHNTANQMVEQNHRSNLLDVLATLLPPNYQEDPNPLEPTHLKEVIIVNTRSQQQHVKQEDDFFFEPMALFENPFHAIEGQHNADANTAAPALNHTLEDSFEASFPDLGMLFQNTTTTTSSGNNLSSGRLLDRHFKQQRERHSGNSNHPNNGEDTFSKLLKMVSSIPNMDVRHAMTA